MWWLHHRSNRTDAIPLMFIQRWPRNFMEVGNILPGLLSAPNASMPAFHVVAPSIPSFSFSPAPLKPGWGARELGSASNALVQQLGYSKFVIQGGDLGGAILRHMAGDDLSSVVSVIENMRVVAPNATDLQRSVEGFTTADENLTITNLIRFDTEVSRISSRARDVTPAGRDWHDRQPGGERDVDLQFEDAITWSTMYYIQGPYGGMHFYKGMSEKGTFSGYGFENAYPYVHQAVATSEFHEDFWFGRPLDWARRKGNVLVRNVHTSGGHFAALKFQISS